MRREESHIICGTRSIYSRLFESKLMSKYLCSMQAMQNAQFRILQTHLPGYVKEATNLKKHGIGEIICVAVNDAFVLNAWAKEQGAEGKVIGIFENRPSCLLDSLETITNYNAVMFGSLARIIKFFEELHLYSWYRKFQYSSTRPSSLR